MVTTYNQSCVLANFLATRQPRRAYQPSASDAILISFVIFHAKYNTLNSGGRRMANTQYPIYAIRHTFLLSSTFVRASIKQPWAEGNCLDVSNTPQNIFNFVPHFFCHHTRHIICHGRRTQEFIGTSWGRFIRSYPECKPSKDPGRH